MDATADFDEVYAAAFRRLAIQVFAMTGDLGEAEDAVQEAFARAWQRWSRVGALAAPEAWIRMVAFRIAVSSWRRAVARGNAHRRHGPPGPAPGLSPDHLALVDGLRRIPVGQRSVIVLHYLAGLPVDEIAHTLAIPVNTVKTRLHRGRQALAPHVSEYAEEAGSKGMRSDV
jgi:RNA polymerase sigma-70 factor (ECF subfamily)